MKAVEFKDDKKCKRESHEAHMELYASDIEGVGLNGLGMLQMEGYGTTPSEALASLKEIAQAMVAEIERQLAEAKVSPEADADALERFRENVRSRYR